MSRRVIRAREDPDPIDLVAMNEETVRTAHGSVAPILSHVGIDEIHPAFGLGVLATAIP